MDGWGRVEVDSRVDVDGWGGVKVEKGGVLDSERGSFIDLGVGS